MNEAWNATGVDWNGGGKSGTVRFGSDEQLLVMFYNRAVEIPSKSLDHGVRWTENQIFVKIQHPGETLNVVDRPATDQDKSRFRRQWSMFLQNRMQVPEGTPIDLLFPNHPSVGENLRAMGVYTIQQCAKLSSSAIDNIGRGGQEYVNRAQAYLAQADKGKNFHQLQKKVEERDTEIRVLQHQVTQLKSQLDTMLGRQAGDPTYMLNPPFIPGFDAQSERINANHPTQEIAAQAKKSRRPRRAQPVEVEPVDPITDPLAKMRPLAEGGLENNPDIDSTDQQDATI